jgi:hypothetical protein
MNISLHGLYDCGSVLHTAIVSIFRVVWLPWRWRQETLSNIGYNLEFYAASCSKNLKSKKTSLLYGQYLMIKDTTWYIRCCNGGTVSVSKWEEARQRLLVLSDVGNSEDKTFASNEAKWMHHNRKLIPPKYNNSQTKLLLSRPHRDST